MYLNLLLGVTNCFFLSLYTPLRVILTRSLNGGFPVAMTNHVSGAKFARKGVLAEINHTPPLDDTLSRQIGAKEEFLDIHLS